MRCPVLLRFVLVAFLFFQGVLYAADEDVDDILALAIAVPEAIQSGKYKIHSSFQQFEKFAGDQFQYSDKPFVDFDSRFYITFDKEKVRIDREFDGRKTVYSLFYENPEQFFFFEPFPKYLIRKESQFPNLSEPNFGKLILYSKKELTSPKTRVLLEDRPAINVKSIGYFAGNISHQVVFAPNLKQEFQHLITGDSGTTHLQDGLSVSRVDYLGDTCYKISIKGSILPETVATELQKKSRLVKATADGKFVFLTDAEVREQYQAKQNLPSRELIIDAGKNYALRRDARFDADGKLTTLLENDLKQDKKTGLWYPASWKYERYSRGKLAEREKSTLEAFALNEPVDPKKFTLKGIEALKPGTKVEWKLDSPPPGKGKLEWDGEVVRSQYGEDAMVVAPNQRANSIWLIVFINIAVLSGIFAYKYYRVIKRRDR